MKALGKRADKTIGARWKPGRHRGPADTLELPARSAGPAFPDLTSAVELRAVGRCASTPPWRAALGALLNH